jgi:fructosamine-3-kinase
MNDTWTTHLYALLPHPNRPAVLGVVTPKGLALPFAILDGQLDTAQINLVQDALGPVCGLPFNVLRCLACVENPDERRLDALFLLEKRADFGGHEDVTIAWVAPKDVNLFGTLAEPLQAGIEKWLAVQENRVSVLCADWARPGWYSQAEDWIRAQLAGVGLSVRAVEPLKSWAISVVLRVRTEDERTFFFKASRSLPLFVNEGLTMTGLARLYPANVPLPVAVDAARGWMLLADFGVPLRRQATLEQQVQMYQTMARLQVVSIRQIGALLQAGCIYRPIPWLQAHLEELLADEYSLSPLRQEERNALIHGLPRLRMWLDELNALPIPPALIHGDLHFGNVALVNGHFQFFDWTDAAVSHPFFDIFDIFTTEDSVQREKLEAAYCAIWAEAYPEAMVRRALRLARLVYGLYHAVSYSVIVNNLGPDEREDFNGAHFFLRQVLDGLSREEEFLA